MNVYAESNFVLELALQQEEADGAERLLELARAGRIRLAVPAFSLAEPYETLTRRAKRRADLGTALAVEIRELARSQPYAAVAQASREFADVLVASAADERERIGSTITRLASTADVLPLTADVARAGLRFQQSLRLTPQDALVFASVDADLSTAPAALPKVFVNRNHKDFLNHAILSRLHAANCKLLTSFSDAAALAERNTRERS